MTTFLWYNWSRSDIIGVYAEPEVSVGAGWQGVVKFRVDGISGRDYPSGVGCTVADSNADGESVDALMDVLSVHQVCTFQCVLVTTTTQLYS